MSNFITDAENWLSNAIKTVLSWITSAQKFLQPELIIAENILNGIKNFEESEEGQVIEAVIEAEIPASTGLINAFFLQLPVWLKELKLLEQKLTVQTLPPTLTEQWLEAKGNLAAMSDDTYACTMNSLKALFTKFFANNNGYAANIQQCLTLGQPTHDLALVTAEPIGK